MTTAALITEYVLYALTLFVVLGTPVAIVWTVVELVRNTREERTYRADIDRRHREATLSIALRPYRAAVAPLRPAPSRALTERMRQVKRDRRAAEISQSTPGWREHRPAYLGTPGEYNPAMDPCSPLFDPRSWESINPLP